MFTSPLYYGRGVYEEAYVCGVYVYVEVGGQAKGVGEWVGEVSNEFIQVTSTGKLFQNLGSAQ